MIKTFKTFYGFLFRYKKAFIAFVLVLSLATILENLVPYVYKLLIDSIPSRNYQLTIKIILLCVGIKIAKNLLDSLGSYLGDRVIIPASKDAQLTIFRHIQDLDFAFHVNKNTGSLISAFKRGGGAFFEFFENLHYEIFSIIISLFVVLFFFFKITPLISLLMLLIFVMDIIVGVRLIKINMERRRLTNESDDKISGTITDNLINYETVKFFVQESKEEKRLEKQLKELVNRMWRYFNSFRLMDITIGTLSHLGILAILGITLRQLIAGKIGAGDFVMVLSFTDSFYHRFFRLIYRLRRIATSHTDIERYFSILDEEILVKDPKKPVKIKKIKGEIKFENVSFRYPEQKKNILTNINLEIKPDESIAFVGRSGVGKTTLIRLLLRFYDMDKGRILIDGIDIRNLTKSQLRSFIGVVPQEPILFNNTIEFNIGYGKPRPTRKEIIEAAKMANLHDFIESSPKKYKTQVGERGIKLSGGQKQRLAIARMLLTEPEIIIFDEATSQLDSESEALIQDALWKIAKNRTVLIIAHRFATVRRAKKIAVLEKGTITEIGTHQELIKKKGIYSYLLGLQSEREIFKK